MRHCNAALFPALLAWACGANAAEPAEPSSRLVVKAYIFDYASVAFEATQAVKTDVPNDRISPFEAPVNQFAYADALAGPGPGAIIHPNADTIYTEAWLDLSHQPMVLHVPDTSGRYYLIPLYDAYTNVFASIGTRTTGAHAGDYAIVGPNWSGRLPPGLSGVIRAPTDSVRASGRTLVQGPGDVAAVVALTRKYTLTPLDHFGKPYKPPAHVPVKSPDPDFVARPVTSAEGFSQPEFFTYSASFLYRNPPPLSERALAALYRRKVLPNADLLTPALVQTALADMGSAYKRTAITLNNWTYNLHVGDYDKDYALRASVALTGFGANKAADAVYAHTAETGDGTPLMGSDQYTIHFAAGQIPPARGFWSLTVYDQRGFLIPNVINRYDVGSESGLRLNADGSLDITLGPTAPSANVTNWLPTPAGKLFTLTLRIYWPKQIVLDGKYAIPPVMPLRN